MTKREEAARWLAEAWGDSFKAEEMLLALTERESNREDESSGRTAGSTREQIGEEREVLVAGTPMPKKPRPGSTPGTPDHSTPTPPSDGPLHNHAPIADEVADAILDYGNECGQWAKDPTHPFGRERVAKSLAGLHQRIAAALAPKPTPPSDGKPAPGVGEFEKLLSELEVLCQLEGTKRYDAYLRETATQKRAAVIAAYEAKCAQVEEEHERRMETIAMCAQLQGELRLAEAERKRACDFQDEAVRLMKDRDRLAAVVEKARTWLRGGIGETTDDLHAILTEQAAEDADRAAARGEK